MHDELTLDRNSGLFDALESLAEEAGVPIYYAFKAALHNFVDHAAEEFIKNPRAERFRMQTEEELNAAIMAVALSPDESEKRIKKFLNAYGADLCVEDKHSIAESMQSLDTHALEMKVACEAMMSMTANQTVH